MESIKRAIEYVRDLWEGLNSNQKVYFVIALAILGVTFVGLAGVTALWSDDGGMRRVVGVEASAEEHKAVLDLVRKQNVPYEIRNGGIYVDSRRADELAFELSGMLSDDSNFKFLYESDLTAGRWVKEKRFQVAIQRKLERMIGKVEGVIHAGVVLVPGSETGRLFRHGRKASASVQVELRRGEKLGRSSVKAIIGFVAHAVPFLEMDRVQLMDTAGNSYRLPAIDSGMGQAVTMNELEEQQAEVIRLKLLGVLPGNPRIGVNVKMKRTNVDRTSEKHGPPVDVEFKERKRSDKGSSGSAVPGIKGEKSVNLIEVGITDKRDETESESHSKSRVDRTVEHTQDPAGAIERVTVGVVFPVDVDGEDTKKAMAEAEAMIPKWKNMVKQVAGAPSDEDVSFVVIPVRRPAPLPPPGFLENMDLFLERFGGMITAAVLVIVVFILLWWFLRKALPRGDVMQDVAGRLRTVSDETVGAPFPEVALVDEEVGRMKVGIRDMVTRNPRGVAEIMKRWLLGK